MDASHWLKRKKEETGLLVVDYVYWFIYIPPTSHFDYPLLIHVALRISFYTHACFRRQTMAAKREIFLSIEAPMDKSWAIRNYPDCFYLFSGSMLIDSAVSQSGERLRLIS